MHGETIKLNYDICFVSKLLKAFSELSSEVKEKL